MSAKGNRTIGVVNGKEDYSTIKEAFTYIIDELNQFIADGKLNVEVKIHGAWSGKKNIAWGIVLRKPNKWDATADVLRHEKRQWELKECKRMPRSYGKKDDRYWESDIRKNREKGIGNRCSCECKQACRRFYEEKVNNNGNVNPSKWWRQVKQLAGLSKPNLLTSIFHDGEFHYGKDLAEIMFLFVNQQKISYHYQGNKSDFLPTPCLLTLYDYSISVNSVEKALAQIQTKKSIAQIQYQTGS
ncbi:Hypothetical predicted protein [Paramuricea clavata]|uniref:Uncharacterized protein n=1 Tax=Paramuricea clavata TaxID=317549 RepID=A0A7D9HC63_PARCT|nr:Hypothetical predicted protein [Paramuricea clavata]